MREDERIHDAIVIGSGAGGSAAAWRLAQAGWDVLLLEKGERLPDDGSTYDPDTVLGEGRFKSSESWRLGDDADFVPEECFNLGGKTRWYGAALLRFANHEFLADPVHGLLGWPLTPAQLEPYYLQAEQLLQLQEFPIEPDLARILRSFTDGEGWQIAPIPLGLAAGIGNEPRAATHFDGYALPHGLKSDAQHRFLDRAAAGLRVRTGMSVQSLLADLDDWRRVGGVSCADGSRFRARHVLLAAGAMHSPRLLQRYLRAQPAPADALLAKPALGGNYKRHLLTVVLGFSWRRQHDRLRKTRLLLNTRFPHSSVQPLGGWIDRDIVCSQLPRWLPTWLADRLAERVYGFFLQTEDASDPANRISETAQGQPRLDYTAEATIFWTEHQDFVAAFRRGLRGAGFLNFKKVIPDSGTAHACGTLAAGDDPGVSAVDAQGRVHGLHNLIVVDGSVLPRIGRLNPALSIYAWALRAADRLIEQGV